MMNTAEAGVAFAERVGSPNCKILLDTVHMNIEEDTFRQSILTPAKLLGIRRESARGPDACSPRGNAPSDQLAADGRLLGTAAPSLDTQAEER
jgi:hypothetical protein